MPYSWTNHALRSYQGGVLMSITITVTNDGLNAVRDNLNKVAGATSLGITYLAIGTGTQATPATAHGLANEVFRMAITGYANGANPGEGLISALLSPTSAAGFAISEVGFFGGAATGTSGSGTLFFYALFSHTHTGTESIQFTADSTV